MDSTPRTNPLLRRRNSIATSAAVPAKLTLPTKPHHAATFPTAAAHVDFDLISIKPLSYISLKDLLPSAAVQSPTAAGPGPGGGQSGYEIPIRNRLVKQAAWAYLQPMSNPPESAGRHFLHRLSAILCFVTQTITRALDQLVRAIRVWSFR